MSDIDVLMKELKDVQGAVADKVAAGLKPVGEEIARMGKAITEAQTAVKEMQTKQSYAITNDTQLLVKDGRYAGYNAHQLSAASALLEKVASLRGEPLSEIQAHKDLLGARKSLKASISPEFIQGWEDKHVQALACDSTRSMDRRKAKEIVSPWANQMRKEWARTKAMDSVTANAGDELVPTLEAATLWMDVNLNTTVLPVMRQVPMPSNPFDWPTQFGNTNWYPMTSPTNQENIQVTTTTPTTDKVTLNAYGLKTGVPFSDELNEDSVVALVPELRSSLARNAAEVIDDVLLNGDTTATNGINSDGAVITNSTPGKAHWLLGFDGMIHLPLVTAAAGQRVDRNGAVTAADVYNRALRAIGKYGAAQVMGDVVFFSDVNTAIASLTMDEVELVTNFGPRATISTGELARIYGVPIVVSGQMRLADTDGKVTDAGNGTNTGRVLATNISQWAVGFRRGITFEPDREPGKGQTTLYVSMRIALQQRNSTASAATHSSLIYDITGVV